jgi:ketosteroid isomerase-like protein
MGDRGVGIIERFFECLSARDWESLASVLAPDVERFGPFGDRVVGRRRYLDLLAGTVPLDYRNDVHQVTYAADGRSCFARVTEHLSYPEQDLHLQEAYSFHIDEAGVVSLVEVFWQTPQLDPGGLGSAGSEESFAARRAPGTDVATEAR